MTKSDPAAWKSCCCNWVAFWILSLKAFVTSRWSWRWIVERGRPPQGKLVTFPVRWWRFYSLLITDCDTQNCLATFSWILPFCSIFMALHLSFSVERCMTGLEDRNPVSVGLWILRGLNKRAVHTIQIVFYVVGNRQWSYPVFWLWILWKLIPLIFREGTPSH